MRSGNITGYLVPRKTDRCMRENLGVSNKRYIAWQFGMDISTVRNIMTRSGMNCRQYHKNTAICCRKYLLHIAVNVNHTNGADTNEMIELSCFLYECYCKSGS